MEMKYRQIENSVVKEFNDEEFSIVHFITTEDTDRYGDIVRADGMDDNNYRNNPVVLYGHNSYSFPVGKSLWRRPAFKDGVKGILAKTQFTQATEEGRIAYQLWKEGMLNGASIGFLPKENGYVPIKDVSTDEQIGWDFKQWELYEYSIVPIPANPKALRLAFEKGLTNNKIFKDIEDAVVKEEKILIAQKEAEEMEKLLARITALETALEDAKSIISNLIEKVATQEKTLEKLDTFYVENVAKQHQEEVKSLIDEMVRGAFSIKHKL